MTKLDTSGILVHGALVIALLLLGVGYAWPHSWYTGTTNPVTGGSCCGRADCRPFPEERVTVIAGGYLLSLPGGKQEVVPYAETLPSRDGRYHRCDRLAASPTAGERICFFAPPQAF